MGGYVIGVDAGGSKTVALVASQDGQVLGKGKKGGIDFYKREFDAIEIVLEAANEALNEAGIRQTELSSSVFSMSGADWPEDHRDIKTFLITKGWRIPTKVVNDAIGALIANIPEGPGIVLACGTGAGTASRGIVSNYWHSSFWQDVQGAQELTLKTLQCICRSELQITSNTNLKASVLNFLNVSSVMDALHLYTMRPRFRTKKLPSLTKVLFDEAEKGDTAARNLIIAHGQGLAMHIVAAALQVEIQDIAVPLVLTGGIFRHTSTLLIDTIMEETDTRIRLESVKRGAVEPVIGAVILALNMLLDKVDSKVRSCLAANAPPLNFFE